MKPSLFLAILLLAVPAAGLAQNGQYLGNLSANPYAPNSTSNPFGAGNPYNPDSINNPFGTYGNPYSPNSQPTPTPPTRRSYTTTKGTSAET